MNRYNVELEEYSMYSVCSTSKNGAAGNSGDRFQRLWTFISVPSEIGIGGVQLFLLFQLFLFLKNLKRIMQSKICTSFAHLLF